MKAETKKAFLRLKKLAGEAKANVYERAGLAARVMADADWFVETHGGDTFKAAEAVMSEYFPDLSGWLTLESLIGMHRDIPHAKWESWKHNLAVITGFRHRG